MIRVLFMKIGGVERMCELARSTPVVWEWSCPKCGCINERVSFMSPDICDNCEIEFSVIEE